MTENIQNTKNNIDFLTTQTDASNISIPWVLKIICVDLMHWACGKSGDVLN